uniref:Cathepsin propeptide inhibitor domain-containing protein n=1 Tax=viral metagenome TaxID=1070528 RepID=A0A6C0IF09_9ZZZZ
MFNIFYFFFFCHFVKGENNFPSNKYFLDEVEEWKQFSLFEQKYNKNYETFIELEKRFQIFKKNLQTIHIHNVDKERNFTMTINQFTDLTSDEIRENILILV